MVNSEEFGKRLQKILEYYDISAAIFADAIQVGRSSISHILSGRNKPSLDFVLKIVQTYPEVELYWLLNGKGDFPKSEDRKVAILNKPEISNQVTKDRDEEPHSINSKEGLPPTKNISENRFSAKTIKRVVLFYEDGTFEAFDN